MSLDEFRNNCIAQGGNWTSMVMSGIKNLSKNDCTFKKIYEEMPDKSYDFQELMEIIELYVDLTSIKRKK